MILVVGDLVADVRVAPCGRLSPAAEVPGSITLHGGGSAANQAAWLAAQGHAVRFVGRVGLDPLGEWLVAELRAAGVEVHAARDPVRPTGAVCVLVEPGGERALVTSPAANAALAPEDVPPHAWRGVRLLVLTGYTFAHPAAARAGLALIRAARRRGIPVAVDPGSHALLARHPGRSRFLRWTAGARFCFPNREEARFLSGEADPLAAARRLLGWYEAVAVKAGAAGCAVAWRDARGPAAAWVPARPVPRVADTTGAGDAFAAGFLAAWLRGAGPVAAAQEGHRLAAQAVALPGGRPPGGLRAPPLPGPPRPPHPPRGPRGRGPRGGRPRP